MYYGIDLGTTNSLIGCGEYLYTGLVSSSVNIEDKRQCSRDSFGDSIVSSYKVNMTTGSEGELSIACSAVILRDLANRASAAIGEEVKDVVISVPAKFYNSQRNAVIEAGTRAGLNVVGLINEPTAGAIAICRDMKDLVVVYDLGGGTFDVTIIDSRAGNYYVVATDGEVKAGDNFDAALCDYAIASHKVKIRYQTPDNLKRFITEIRTAKETIQRTGLTQYVDMSYLGSTVFEITESLYVDIMKKTFQSTVDLTRRLIATHLDQIEEPKIIFVGGSTNCPYLRGWILEETGLKYIEGNIAPDYIVAQGVALYAEMLYNGTAEEQVDDVTNRICIEDNLGRAITIVEKNTTIPVSEVITVCNPKAADKLEINLYQGDSLFCSSNEYIGTLIYDYGEVREKGDGYVDIEVTVNRDGVISLTGTDILTNISQDVKLVLYNRTKSPTTRVDFSEG